MIFSTKWLGLMCIAACVSAVVIIALPREPALSGPQTVIIPAGNYAYRPAGDFRNGTRIVDAPIQQRSTTTPLHIMKYHVSQADYYRCVQAKACRASQSSKSDAYPQVNVSYFDATAYAAWLSKATRQTWRLPTDEEWARAAGDRFHESLLGDISNDPDPSKRWIAKYKEEAARRGQSDPELREIGHFGLNDHGVGDINGNIWEWTTSCFRNGKVSEDGTTLLSNSDYCGVRAAQGSHRAFITEFVRDAKSGGCAVGIPPDNLGIRLVLERG